MVSPFVKAELTAACNSLGSSDGAKYHKETYCLEALKDLIRYLRRDDENHGIRRELGETKVVQTDLIPIVCEYYEDAKLFDITLRLIVNLTNPPLLLFREELPEEKVTRNYFLQMVGHVQLYKIGFASENFWKVLTKKLGDLLQLDWEKRMEDDKLIIERILILIRNILHIPASPEDEKRTEDDASVHDQVLWSMHLSGMDDLILYLASSDNERHFCMHVMEIISLMLREQNPQHLAQAAAKRSTTEKKEDVDHLLLLRQREAAEKAERMRKISSSRFSRFAGTYTVKDVKSISDKDMITHRPIFDTTELDFSHDKKPQRKPKNRLPMSCAETTRRSTLSIRLFLKEFCVELLNGAYNSLMHAVKDNLVRMRAQEHDESYYLWAMKFFMEFNRNYKFRVELVSETMSVSLFHYIQQHLENYSEMIRLEKKKVALWSRRLHLALKAYQELFMTLGVMDKCPAESIKESAKVIKANIFYVLEYRELCLVLLQNFDEVKHSRAYLKDLVETTHIFLKLLEQFCSTNKHVIVQKKVRKRKSKSKRNQKKKTQGSENPPTEATWDDISGDLNSALQGDVDAIEIDVVPFDAALETPVENQQTVAVGKIRASLKNNKMIEAIALLRASRNVWPMDDVFGSADAKPEEELLILREIFLADLPEALPEERNEADGHDDQEIGDKEEDDEQDEEEEEATMAFSSVSEQELDFKDFAYRFAHHKVVQAYGLLLRDYATNSALTNHCIAKMLHRVAFDCKLPAMLFQVSVFRTFQKILHDPRSEIEAALKELSKFAKFIVGKFVKISTTNRKVFMELLFWKTARDATEIEQGYGSYKEASRSSRLLWTEEEEDELERLYHELRVIEDPERDIVDRVMANLINNNKSRRLVIKKMRDMGLINNAKDIARSKSGVKIRPPKDWQEQEIAELKQLFEEVRESSDPLGLLVDRLSVKRPKRRIREKILELGLVSDASELRKKRSSKRGAKKLISGEISDNSSDSEPSDVSSVLDSDSDDDGAFLRFTESIRADKNRSIANFQAQLLITPMKELISNGHKEALEWLVECLEETVQDLKGSQMEESVPLVPLMESANKAMDDRYFLQFLRKVGIASPANEQEQFWRIPHDFSTGDLEKRIEFLRQGLRGNLETAGSSREDDNPAGEDPMDQDNRVEDHSEEAEENTGTSNRVAWTLNVNESGDIDDEDGPHFTQKRRRFVLEDSSDSESEPQREEAAAQKPKKRIAILESDSE